MSVVEDQRDNLVFASSSRLQSRATVLQELSFVESSAHDRWSVIYDQLLGIRSLDDDWDGEGSDAPKTDLVDGALTIATWLKSEGWEAPDRALASVNGCVVLEWYLSEGFLEIEVCSPTQAKGTFVPRGGNLPETFIMASN